MNEQPPAAALSAANEVLNALADFREPETADQCRSRLAWIIARHLSELSAEQQALRDRLADLEKALDVRRKEAGILAEANTLKIEETRTLRAHAAESADLIRTLAAAMERILRQGNASPEVRMVARLALAHHAAHVAGQKGGL